MKDTINADELRKEKDKLEGDRTALNERLQAINAERERIIQQMTMIAGALQTLNHFIDKIDPEVDLEDDRYKRTIKHLAKLNVDEVLIKSLQKDMKDLEKSRSVRNIRDYDSLVATK